MALTMENLQAVIGHLQRKMGKLEQAYHQGIIAQRDALLDAVGKTERAIALNTELVENIMRGRVPAGEAVYTTQLPGVRVPYWIIKDITVPAANASRRTAVEATPASGPFEVAQIMATARAQVAYGVTGVAVVRELRFRSINSAISDPAASPNPAAVAQPSYSPDTTYNFVFDFLMEYQTGKSNRFRMNAPIPSPFLFTEQGRPCYLACGDALDKADTLTWNIDPLTPTRAWLGGVFPGAVADTPQPVVVTIGMHGILYTQPMDYRP